VNTTMTILQDIVGVPLTGLILIFVLKVLKVLFVGLPEEVETAEETPPQPMKRRSTRVKVPVTTIKPAEDDWFSFDARLLDDYDPRDE